MLEKTKALVEPFIQTNPQGVLAIIGPTASGKTSLSVDLALWIKEHFGQECEIISVDSRQVYRGCNISSAKITVAEMKGVTHHGLDLVDLEVEYSVYDWQQYCVPLINEIIKRGHVPILAGGTMLWLDAVTENYDFDEKGIKSDRRHEPLWSCLKIGIEWPREKLYERINERAIAQFEGGMIQETIQVLKEHPQISRSAFTSFGYQEIKAYLEGLVTYEEALKKNQQRNRNYAKKQLTWWRGREDVNWVS